MACFLSTQLWQGGTVEALRAEHIGVKDLDQLLRSEGFRRTKDHVPHVVDDDIQAAVFLNHSFNSPVG